MNERWLTREVGTHRSNVRQVAATSGVMLRSFPRFYFPIVPSGSLPECSTTDNGQERWIESGPLGNQRFTARDCTQLKRPRISKREQDREWDRTHCRRAHQVSIILSHLCRINGGRQGQIKKEG
jgi:hypothetical protein